MKHIYETYHMLSPIFQFYENLYHIKSNFLHDHTWKTIFSPYEYIQNKK